MKLTWNEVCARRLARHHLTDPCDLPVADVVRNLASTHAQVMSAAELGLGLRVRGATRQTVRDALWRDRTLVKTYGPRGTVHLLPAEDLPVWLGALEAVPNTVSLPPILRMTPEQEDAIIEAIRDALEDAELTIDELDDEVVGRTGPYAGERVMDAFQTKWPRWRRLMHTAAHRGALSFGAGRGRKVTYTSPRTQAAPARESLEQVALWYLNAYGPATPERFAHFMSGPRPWAREIFSRLDLTEVEVEGERAFVAAGDTAVPVEPARGVRLLPYFDHYSYVVGNFPRELLYPGPAFERVRGNFQTLVVDGVVAGLWHHKRSGKRLDVTVEALTPLDRRQLAELEEQVLRVGEILEAAPSLTLGKVTSGSHA